MIRVQVAIDSFLVRSAVAAALRAEPDLEVIAETTDAAEGAAQAAGLGADVIVLSEPFDRTPAKWVFAYRVAAPRAKVVLLLMSTRAVDLPGRGGADEALDGGDGIDELIRAVRRAAGR